MGVLASPLDKLEQLKHAASQARLPFEREGWLNLAFYLSQQYSEWNPETNSIQQIARLVGEENAPRPVVNKIMHFVRSTHHEALQDEPWPDVLAASDDYQDISDALVATAWCDQQAGETLTDYHGRLSRATLWAIIAGNGYLKWAVDPETRQLRVTVPSYFEMYLDPYAKEFKDCRHIIQSQFMDVEQVYDTFGVDVRPEAVQKADEQKTVLLRGMGCAPVVQGVTVNELWMKPSRRHPNGRYAVWTGRELLIEPDDLPYPHLIKHRMLPFTNIGCIERPDSPYYLSPVQFLRPPQMELNKYHAQRIKIRECFANPKWWIDSAIDLETEPDDSPSQILRGNSSVPGIKPELIQPTTYPPSDDGEMLEQQMMHLVGSHEVSNAQVPGRVEAAKAIELLKEADAGAQAMLVKTIRTSNSQGWFHALELARKFLPQEDMVVAYSREGVPEVKHFRAGEMKPGYRVRTTTTSGLGRSRAGRNDMAMRLWDSKAITDPDQLLDLLDIPSKSVLKDRFQDMRAARNENLELAQGIAVAADSWDNHAEHIRQHNAYRKTTDFRELPGDAKRKFEMHVQSHKKLLRDSIAEQAELQQIAQGMPGAPAGPVQPEQPAPTQPPNQEQEGT